MPKGSRISSEDDQPQDKNLQDAKVDKFIAIIRQINKGAEDFALDDENVAAKSGALRNDLNPHALRCMSEWYYQEEQAVLFQDPTIIQAAFGKEPDAILNAAIVVAEIYPAFLENVLFSIAQDKIYLNKAIALNGDNISPLNQAIKRAILGYSHALIIMLKHANKHDIKLESFELVHIGWLLRTMYANDFDPIYVELIRHFNENAYFNSIDYAAVIKETTNLSNQTDMLGWIINSATLGYPKILLSLLTQSTMLIDILQNLKLPTIDVELSEILAGRVNVQLALCYQHPKTPKEIKQKILECLQKLNLDAKEILSFSTPIGSAIFANDTDSVKAICENAKEKRALDTLEDGLIGQAAFYGHYEIILILMEYMFDKPTMAVTDKPIDKPIYDGWSLVHLFAANGFAKGIEALAEFGADFNKIGKNGNLALSLAIIRSFVGNRQKYTETIKTLLAHGAEVDIEGKSMTPLCVFVHQALYWQNGLAKLVAQSEKALKAHTVISYPAMLSQDIVRLLLSHYPIVGTSDLNVNGVVLPQCFGFMLQDNIASRRILALAKKNPSFLKEMKAVIKQIQETKHRFDAVSFSLFDAFKRIQERREVIAIPTQLVGKILEADAAILQCKAENEIQKRVKGMFLIWNKKEERLSLNTENIGAVEPKVSEPGEPEGIAVAKL